MMSNGYGQCIPVLACGEYGPPAWCTHTPHWYVQEPITTATTGGSSDQDSHGYEGASSRPPKQYTCVYCGHTRRTMVLGMTALDKHTIVSCQAAPTSAKLHRLVKTRSREIRQHVAREPWYMEWCLNRGEPRTSLPYDSREQVSPPNVTSGGRSATGGGSTAGHQTTGSVEPPSLVSVSPSAGIMDPELVEQMNSSLAKALKDFNVPESFVDSPNFRDFVICLNRDCAPHVASAHSLIRVNEKPSTAAAASAAAASGTTASAAVASGTAASAAAASGTTASAAVASGTAASAAVASGTAASAAVASCTAASEAVVSAAVAFLAARTKTLDDENEVRGDSVVSLHARDCKKPHVSEYRKTGRVTIADSSDGEDSAGHRNDVV